jgi:D-alanyl-D-alanine carboxypeptidase (penicillin-binding protein 5/6)
MGRFRVGRFVGVLTGAVVILGAGIYGPATLLGPLPAASVTLLTPAVTTSAPPPVLPVAGASAIAALPSAPSDAATPSAATPADLPAPIASAGSTTALPMASAAKLITALVALDARPLAPSESGESFTATPADFQGYLDYAAAGARTVSVYPGEVWTERELLQAVVLASSNNHADTLARWAFGSLEKYRAAASDWLTAQGLDDTAVVDATGLDEESAGTAVDLARLAGIAAANPTIAEILAHPTSTLADRSGVSNTTATLTIDGVSTLSRSYTDAAGVCLLFTATVEGDGSPFTVSGAFLGEPDYDTLTADLDALMESARVGVALQPVLNAGDAYARFETPWGDTASGVVRTTKTRLGWQPTQPDAAVTTVDRVTTGRAGQRIGTVELAPGTAGPSLSAPLVLDGNLTDPGPGWRLLNPIPVISALIQAQQDEQSADPPVTPTETPQGTPTGHTAP